METFHCVPEGTDYGGDVLEDEAGEAHAGTFDEADCAVIARATIGLGEDTGPAVVDAVGELFAGCFEA